jgi:hypothetical protein
MIKYHDFTWSQGLQFHQVLKACTTKAARSSRLVHVEHCPACLHVGICHGFVVSYLISVNLKRLTVFGSSLWWSRYDALHQDS